MSNSTVRWEPIRVETFSSEAATLAVADAETVIIQGNNDAYEYSGFTLPANVRLCRAVTVDNDTDRYTRWQPIDHLINDNLTELQADNIAVTIGHGDTALATFAWPDDGQYAVCRAVPVDAPRPLEMPDSPGWWAYRDTIPGKRRAFVVHLPVFESYPDNVRYQWTYDDHFVFVLPLETFRLTWPGQWYKLTMPWEQHHDAPMG